MGNPALKPEVARNNSLEGVVTVQFVVNTEGRAEKIEVVASDASVVDKLASIAPRHARTPSRMGRPPAPPTTPSNVVTPAVFTRSAAAPSRASNVTLPPFALTTRSLPSSPSTI